jgi:NADPH2:quinone reductase
VSLLGCNSAETTRSLRTELWQRLASDWRPRDLELLLSAVLSLDDLLPTFEQMLAGKTHGRIVVKL